MGGGRPYCPSPLLLPLPPAEPSSLRSPAKMGKSGSGTSPGHCTAREAAGVGRGQGKARRGGIALSIRSGEGSLTCFGDLKSLWRLLLHGLPAVMCEEEEWEGSETTPAVLTAAPTPPSLKSWKHLCFEWTCLTGQK